jgi:hypothetical protein
MHFCVSVVMHMDYTCFLRYALQNIRHHRHYSRSAQQFSRLYNLFLNYCRGHQMWCSSNCSRISWHAISWALGLGVMDQFHGLRAHPTSRRLISSCGDTLRTCSQDPCDLPRWTEAQNFCCDRNGYTANAGEHLEGKLAAWTSYVPRKTRMLKFSILPYGFFHIP